MTAQLSLFFSAFLTLAIVHQVAITFFLYWRYWWFDIAMHFLGGIVVSLGIAILPFVRIRLPRAFSRCIGYVAIVLTVGITWEVFEYVSGISVNEANFVVDTLTDLTMDALGAIIGYGIVRSTNT